MKIYLKGTHGQEQDHDEMVKATEHLGLMGKVCLVWTLLLESNVRYFDHK